MKRNSKELLSLFLTFLKIGAFTFGGGYAMISLIQKETVSAKHWITDDDILDIIAVAESTPGPIAINASTFVGYKVGGFFGAAAATLGVILPSFVIITVISFFLEQFESLKAVKFAFNGIRVGVVVLILKALTGMYKKSPKGLIPYGIMIFAFVCTVLTKINVLAVLFICVGAGFAFSYFSAKENEK